MRGFGNESLGTAKDGSGICICGYVLIIIWNCCTFINIGIYSVKMFFHLFKSRNPTPITVGLGKPLCMLQALNCDRILDSPQVFDYNHWPIQSGLDLEHHWYQPVLVLQVDICQDSKSMKLIGL